MTVRYSLKTTFGPEARGPAYKINCSLGIFGEHHVVRRTTKKIYFEEPEVALTPQYYVSGYVYEENKSSPVSRDVRLYRRSTGALISSTVSNVAGYYYLGTPYNDDHYVTALDNSTGIQYNLAALDWMTPATIS